MMEAKKLGLVYFSATYTTKRILKLIENELAVDVVEEYDITQTPPTEEVRMESDELLLVGVPVYAGRIPALALHALERIKGNQTPAVIVCVYGNREYDDALLELKQVVEKNGFKAIAAGAFIAQHSIFPLVGQGRPDEKDKDLIRDFARKVKDLLPTINDIQLLPELQVKGNYPYKVPGSIPIQPKGSRKCDACGTCVRLCPVNAISETDPKKTDKDKCISCGRCVIVCPQDARNFGGILYKVAGKKFVSANSARKEPEIVLL